jgi:phosphoglycolate phosphatase
MLSPNPSGRKLMSNFKLALFDFDGTLADSLPFFVSVFNHLAQQHHFKCINENKAEDFRGYSVQKMMAHVGLPFWKLPIVARSFMTLMKENSDSIRLFDGVSDLFQTLKASGITIGIVTSNSHENVHCILGPDNMSCVTYIECGSSIFGKASRITRIIRESGMSSKHAIYFGDQAADLEAARKAKVTFGAVAWGYSSPEALKQHQPDYELNSIVEIGRLLQTTN